MGGSTRISIRVQPRASDNKITGVVDGVWQLRVTAPPVEGEANAAVVALLASVLAVPKRDVTIDRGATGRNKVVRIAGRAEADVLARLRAGAGKSRR